MLIVDDYFWYVLHTVLVRQFYQDANLGPAIQDLRFTATTIGKFTISPSIETVSEGWNVVHNGLKKVCKETAYTSIHI